MTKLEKDAVCSVVKCAACVCVVSVKFRAALPPSPLPHGNTGSALDTLALGGIMAGGGEGGSGDIFNSS